MVLNGGVKNWWQVRGYNIHANVFETRGGKEPKLSKLREKLAPPISKKLTDLEENGKGVVCDVAVVGASG